MAKLMPKLVLFSVLVGGLVAQGFAVADTTNNNTPPSRNTSPNNIIQHPAQSSNMGTQNSSVTPTTITSTDEDSQGKGFLSSSDSKILVLGIFIIICQGFALFWILGKHKKSFEGALESLNKALQNKKLQTQSTTKPNDEIIVVERYLQKLTNEIEKVHKRLAQLSPSVSVPMVLEMPKTHGSGSGTSIYESSRSEGEDLVIHKKPNARMQDILDTVVQVINDMYDSKEAMNVDSVFVSVTSAIGEEKTTQLSLTCKGYYYAGSVTDSNIELFCLGADTDLIAFPYYKNRENTGFDKWFDNGSSQGDKPKLQKLARAKLTAAGTVECLEKGIVG